MKLNENINGQICGSFLYFLVTGYGSVDSTEQDAQNPGSPGTPRPELPSKARLSKSMPGFLPRGSSILCLIHVKNSLKN